MNRLKLYITRFTCCGALLATSGFAMTVCMSSITNASVREFKMTRCNGPLVSSGNSVGLLMLIEKPIEFLMG